MVTQYRITSAITDGTNLTIVAKCCEQIGTRKDEHGNSIPIIKCRNEIGERRVGKECRL